MLGPSVHLIRRCSACVHAKPSGIQAVTTYTALMFMPSGSPAVNRMACLHSHTYTVMRLLAMDRLLFIQRGLFIFTAQKIRPQVISNRL